MLKIKTLLISLFCHHFCVVTLFSFVILIVDGQFADRNLAVDSGIERNNGFRARQTERLQLIVDDI